MTAHAPGTRRHGLATATGRRRDHNQDASLTGPDWFVVADGMGGHAGGGAASRIVVETFATAPLDDAAGATDVVATIRRTCAAANRAVIRTAVREGTHGMGSTVVGLFARAGGVVAFHVGDSRCYRLVDGELRLLTRDHSHVQELIDAGRLTTEQARHHARRNIVTRALGLERTVAVDVVRVDARPSRFLLCSDGLHTELTPRDIGRVLAGTTEPADAAQRLVELAQQGEAGDDMTALVVDDGTIRDNDPTDAGTLGRPTTT